MTGPSYHGRTHDRDGTDPIPGMGLPVWYVPGSQMFAGLQIYNAHTSNDVTVYQDSTVIHACYSRFFGATTDQGPGLPNIIFPVILGRFDGINGPYAGVSGADPETFWGLYWVHMIMRTGPDAAKWKLAIASAVVAEYVQPPWDTDLTWVQIDSGDLYAAGSSWGDPYDSETANYREYYVRLTGDTGDVATSYNPGAGGTLDGGPGLYWFNLYTAGKHASSSNYYLDVAEFGVSIGG